MAYASAMDALGDPTRRRIFELLRSGPRAVGELAGERRAYSDSEGILSSRFGEARDSTHNAQRKRDNES